jgi:hypothetical protein
MHIIDGDKLNEFEVIVVQDYMAKHRPTVTNYTMTPGNECIWVWYGQINEYFIFHNGKLADIQID